MKLLALLLFSLSSWAGTLTVNLEPITPPRCASFHARITINAIQSDGTLIPLGILSPDQNLALAQLDQVPIEQVTVPGVTVPKIAINVQNVACRSAKGGLFSMPNAFVYMASPVDFSATSCLVLALDMHTVKNAAIVPKLSQSQDACNASFPPSDAGVVQANSPTSVTIVQ